MNISQNSLYLKTAIWIIEVKPKDGENDMLDLAIEAIAVLGLCGLPLLFIGYVRSRVRHVLESIDKAH